MQPVHVAVYHADRVPAAEYVALRLLDQIDEPRAKHHWTREPEGRSRSLLHLAAGSGAVGVMKRLLDDAQIDIDALDDQGRTPLHYAAESGQGLAIRLLVDAGADVTIYDAEDLTARALLEERARQEPDANLDALCCALLPARLAKRLGLRS